MSYSQGKTGLCLPVPGPHSTCKFPKARLVQTPFSAAGCSPRCGVWKSLEEAGTWQQVAKQEQQQLPSPSKVSHSSRAERFNHSFPRTFSSEQGLHCSARSRIFPLCSLHSFHLLTDCPAPPRECPVLGWSRAEIITSSVYPISTLPAVSIGAN